MFIDGGLIFKVQFKKRSKNGKKNDIKNEWKHSRGWSLDPYFLILMCFTHGLINPQTNNIVFDNLGPSNELRNAQISHYWHPRFFYTNS